MISKFHDALMIVAYHAMSLLDMLGRRMVEVSFVAKYAIYTIRGSKFDTHEKTRIADHTGVPYYSTSVLSPLSVGSSSSLTSHPLYGIIRDLPLDKTSVHDIHLKFSSPHIYVIVSSSISNQTLGYDYTITPRSKDIRFRFWEINGLRISVTIHRTDTITVVVGCSSNPISLDVNGINRLTNALSFVESRLSRIVKGSPTDNECLLIKAVNSLGDVHTQTCTIPSHSRWTVTLWHFNADSSIEYAGENFSITVETFQNVLIRAYTKTMKDGMTRIRLERQETPNATITDLIEQRINQKHGVGDERIRSF